MDLIRPATEAASPQGSDTSITSTETPSPPPTLFMIHLSDLSINPTANYFRSLYLSTHSKKFRDNSDIYTRSGQIWPVIFAADDTRPRQEEHVIVCSFESCEVCSPSPVPFTGSGLPFVHTVRDFDFNFILTGRGTFEPNPASIGIERTLSDIPLAATNNRVTVLREPGVEFEVEVRACAWGSCRSCAERGFLNPLPGPVPAATWHGELERARVAAGMAGLPAAVDIVAPPSPPVPGPTDGTGGPPPPPPGGPPPPDPGPGPAPTTAPTTATPAAALSPIGGNIRMCHKIHLKFDENTGIVRYQNTKALASFETYFVPEDEPAYQFGGPLHRVIFPMNAFPNRGNVRDVMSCTYKGCRCHRRKTAQPNISNGQPWCHRRHLTGPGRVYNPGLQFQYVEPMPGTSWEAGLVDVDGYNDGVRRRTPCYTCVEGTCEECDEDDEAGGEVVEEDPDVEMGDGDGGGGSGGEDGGEEEGPGDGEFGGFFGTGNGSGLNFSEDRTLNGLVPEDDPLQDADSRPTGGGKKIRAKRSAVDDVKKSTKRRRRR